MQHDIKTRNNEEKVGILDCRKSYISHSGESLRLWPGEELGKIVGNQCDKVIISISQRDFINC